MCGIIGCFVEDSAAYGDRFAAALRSLRHRGPDDAGSEVFRADSREALLGSTRLAIVDLSPSGHMPMRREGGPQAIAFNGEVYNTNELRDALRERGATFRSSTDTEVLLQGLAMDGPQFFDRVDGMYAVAFWDPGDGGSLLLARDRFGEKPLFLYELPDGQVLFASEMRALTMLLEQRPEVDAATLAHIVSWGYPSPGTSIFKGVTKLLPGHWVRYGRDVQRGSLGPLATSPEIDSARSGGRATDLLHAALRTSVAQRMIADVPAGVFLSGGIDSAAVAALAAQALPAGQRLNTYTVGYPGSRFSELKPARAVAEHLGTNHHEIPLSDRHLEALPFVAASLGEPIGDPAALPTYFLSVAARQTSTVLLTGEGSDEVLFGYPRYVLHDLADRVQNGDLVARLMAKLPFRPFTRLREANLPTAERDAHWKGLRPEVYHLADAPTVPSGPDPVGTRGELASTRAARRARNDDVRRWMPESVLARLDRMTMSASIEARAPFLANDVVRLGLHLPDSELRRFPYGKTALRKSLVPEYGRSKAFGMKRPFAVPLLDWLCGPLRAITDETFFGGALAARGWFAADVLTEIGNAVVARKQSVARIAWTLVIVELWARAHLDGRWPEPPMPEAAGRVEVREHQQVG